MKKLHSIIALFLFTVIYFGCKKNNGDVVNSETDKPNLSIAEARIWFSASVNNKRSMANARTDTFKSKLGAFTPLWDKASNTEDDKYYVVESPVKFERAPGYSITTLDNPTSVPINGAARLLILKDKATGEMISALMHVYSSTGSGAEKIKYKQPDEKFSGYIFFTDTDGAFNNGWKYENGKITEKSKKPSVTNTSNYKLAPPDDNGGGLTCSTTTTSTYGHWCWYDQYGDPFNCSPWQFLYSTSVTYCQSSTGGGDYVSQTTTVDCAGVINGTATWDPNCGCIGGTTGRTACPIPCNTFENRVKSVLSTEGGFINDPNDPGGATNKGISWDTWQSSAMSILGVNPTLQNLQNLTDNQAMAIYKNLYWDKVSADQITDGDMRYLVFDFFVNSGGNAVKVLQRTLNQLGSNVSVDGGMGPQTLAAINSANKIDLYNTYKANRQAYYNNIVAINPTQSKWINGWTNRVNAFFNKSASFFTDVNCI